MKRYLLFAGSTDKMRNLVGGFYDLDGESDNMEFLKSDYLERHEPDALAWAHILDWETEMVVATLLPGENRKWV